MFSAEYLSWLNVRRESTTKQTLTRLMTVIQVIIHLLFFFRTVLSFNNTPKSFNIMRSVFLILRNHLLAFCRVNVQSGFSELSWSFRSHWLLSLRLLCNCAGRADPDCMLGQLLKMLFMNDDFTNAVRIFYSLVACGLKALCACSSKCDGRACMNFTHRIMRVMIWPNSLWQHQSRNK